MCTMEITCPKCGFTKDIPDEKIPPRAQVATCPKCSHRFKFRELENDYSNTTQPDITTEDNEKSKDLWSIEKLTDHSEKKNSSNNDSFDVTNKTKPYVPWESLEEHGFFAGFFDTIKMVCMSPRKFFENMSVKGGLTRPLIFYLLISELYTAFRLIWQLIGIGVSFESTQVPLAGLGLHGISSLISLILYPIFLTIVLFIGAGINHLCLLLVRDGSRGFNGTFKVLCYSSAPMIMSIFPLLGPIIGLIWSGVCNFLGYKYVHRTSSVKVAIAMLAPFIVILCITFLLKGVAHV